MKRFVAHVIIQAETPIKTGSNRLDFFRDMPVQRDWNDLPMILGTSIAGVLRKEFDKDDADKIFGDSFKHNDEENKKAKGSSLIISNALLVDENGKVNEGLLTEKNEFLKIFDDLPVREHTAITEKGVAKEHSKFDEEIIFKGTRFKFSMEFIEYSEDDFKKILEILNRPTFRLGGGSTKGFGEFKVIAVTTQKFNEDNYENYSSSLNYKLTQNQNINNSSDDKYDEYKLELTPDDFFMFGSGFGDEDADMTQVYEKVVDYESGKLTDEKILIPASSIKGAIAHRVAFHYNKLKNYFVGNENAKTGEDNDAVKEIFGHKKELKNKEELGKKGKILISDCYLENKNETKVFDHVAIDRFTGGAIEGALFQEKTIAQKDEINFKIYLEKGIEKDKCLDAFEETLKDICRGMLPLGGATTKGHGFFSGKLIKNGEVIYEK